MEAEWYRQALQPLTPPRRKWEAKPDEIVIYDPTAWGQCRDAAIVPYGLGFGYRQYKRVKIHSICKLRAGEIHNCLASFNSAMTYPGEIEVDITKVDDYYTHPKVVSEILIGTGFTGLATCGNWIKAAK